MLKKITVEAALNAEMDEPLGYDKHQKSAVSSSRNGKTSKPIKTEDGEFELDTPHDREGGFQPQLVKKQQTRPLDAVYPTGYLDCIVIKVVSA